MNYLDEVSWCYEFFLVKNYLELDTRGKYIDLGITFDNNKYSQKLHISKLGQGGWH